MPQENSFEVSPKRFDVREEEMILENARPEIRTVFSLITRKAMEEPV